MAGVTMRHAGRLLDRVLYRLGFAVLALCGFGAVAPVHAQAFPPCDPRMFLSQAVMPAPTTLYAIDTSSNPFTFPPIGTGAVNYNAMGFNPADNFIYAMLSGGGGSNTVLRIGSNGIPAVVGTVTGLPVGAYVAGEISPAGVYYVKVGNAATMYAIDITTLTAVAIPLSVNPGSILDFTWNGGLLYGVAGGASLVSISPAGTVTTIGPTGLSAQFGAMFGAPNGVFGNDNGGSGFYQFNLTTGAATLISASPGAQQNDGAHCANAPILLSADLSATKTDGSATYAPGTSVVYTIVVSNNGPFGVSNASVADPLPAGIVSANWTCVGAGGGTCTASGSGAINDLASLPVGATATYTLTLDVPPGFTGNLVNSVTATDPSGFSDPVPGNNSATDTDTQSSQSDLSVSKTNTPGSGPNDLPADTVTQGTQTTYTVVATNNGPSTATGAIVQDPAPAAPLNCPAANPVTCTGAACPGGPITVADLQSGVVLGALPPTAGSNTVTFTFSCAVQ